MGKVEEYSSNSLCVLTRVFFGTKSYARINHLHERALIIVYRTESFCFELSKLINHIIYMKNTQTLAVEIYKAKTKSNQFRQVLEITSKLTL